MENGNWKLEMKNWKIELLDKENLTLVIKP